MDGKKVNVYVLLDKTGNQIPFMYDFNLDALIAKFIRGRLPQLTLSIEECHQIWHLYTTNGWKYIEVFVEINLPEPTPFTEVEPILNHG